MYGFEFQHEDDDRHGGALFFYGPFSPSADSATSVPAARATVLLSSTPVLGKFLFAPHCAAGFSGAMFFAQNHQEVLVSTARRYILL